MSFINRIIRASYTFWHPFGANMIIPSFASSSAHPCATTRCRRFIYLFFVLLLFNSVCVFSVHAEEFMSRDGLYNAKSQEDGAFVVAKIKIEGLQRLPDGTLLNYLPIVVGDPIDDNQVTFAISELYKTGFFADVKLLRDDNTLVIQVVERPSIDRKSFLEIQILMMMH